jgi:hypothetical protein
MYFFHERASLCTSDFVLSVKEGVIRTIGHTIHKKEPITPEIFKQIATKYGTTSSKFMCPTYAVKNRISVLNTRRHEILLLGKKEALQIHTICTIFQRHFYNSV